jgi:hypothetical protein
MHFPLKCVSCSAPSVSRNTPLLATFGYFWLLLRSTQTTFIPERIVFTVRSLAPSLPRRVVRFLYYFYKFSKNKSDPPPKFVFCFQTLTKGKNLRRVVCVENTPIGHPTGWTFVDHSRLPTQFGVSGVCRECVERRRHDLDAFDFEHLRQHLKMNFRHAFFSSENVMSVRSVPSSFPSDSLDSSLSVFLAFSVFIRPF